VIATQGPDDIAVDGGFVQSDGPRVESPFRLLGQVNDDDAELCWTRFRCFDADTGTWISTDPLGIAGGSNLYAFDGSPGTVIDPLGLSADNKTHRAQRAADKISQDAKDGKLKTTPRSHHDEHGFSDEQARQILANPDSVHQSTNGNLVFRKGGDVVVTEGPGSGQGNVITAYGSSGHERGQPGIPGAPVTDEAISGGTIPRRGGGTIPPATKIR
jgi:RHS repeat-associated protein